MDAVLSLAPLTKLAIVLCSVVALIRVRVPIGLSFLGGGGVLAILFPTAWRDLAHAVANGLRSEQTIFLLIIVVGILVFSAALNETGQIRRIIDAFRSLVGTSRLTLVTYPALIGLLPMPGGAIFSAPMVAAAVENSPVSPARKTIANYWFRHIWEYWFPLYPGVILALTLSEVATGRFILAQLPMTVGALLAGYLLILRPIGLDGPRHRDFSRSNLGSFVRELSPILIVVVTVICLVPFTEGLAERLAAESGKSKSVLLVRSPILMGLILGISWLFARRGLNALTLGRLFLKKNILEMLGLVLGLMVFKSIVEGCGAVEAVGRQFESGDMPLLAMVCLLPFVAGALVGIAFGFVGASFPLVIPLVESLPADVDRLPYYCLAYVMGYTGMMFSPTHMCLLLTNQYFKARLLRVYAYLTPLCAFTAVLGLALFWIHTHL